MFTPSVSMLAAISALIAAARSSAQAGVAIRGSSGLGRRPVFSCSITPYRMNGSSCGGAISGG